MRKIVFVVPSLSDSHYRNRIIEFSEKGYQVVVYGFDRQNHKKATELPYDTHSLGEIEDSGYLGRVTKYIKAFYRLGRQYKNDDVLFYLGGLDIAMFFHFVNPSASYVYEECDLTHTYLGKLKSVLEIIDKRLIRKSKLTVTTSEGFINYHFNGIQPSNVVLVENKLTPSVIDYPILKKRVFDQEHISIGFVGGPRFDSVYNFINVYCSHFPNHTFHVFGGPVPKKFEELRKYSNCVFHGFFKNPIDLPEIYSNLDLVLSTYDVRFENVKYAEPNKIYESIYFETPIIVSTGTFLADKVDKLNIGFHIDALNDNEVIRFVESLSQEIIESKASSARLIEKKQTLNINDTLFEYFSQI